MILDTTVVNQDGEIVIQGKATVMPPKALILLGNRLEELHK